MDLTKKRKLDDNGNIFPDSVDNLSVDDVRKIIEPFSHEQLLEIVQNASLRHLDVLNAVRAVADRDLSQRKLFIRGLGWETTTESLRHLFSTYGELDEAVVIIDKATGKSKGYGFITFKHVDGAWLALKEPSKKIDGRMTVTQLASAGITGPVGNPQTVDVSNRKIYVANVPNEMPGERLLAHFLSYGEIEEGPLGFDKATGKSKGFALFVYKNPEGARASLVDPIKNIDGYQLHCKFAIDGKKGKIGAVSGVHVGQAQVPVGVKVETQVDVHGLNPPGSVPASLVPQYGTPGGISPYGGFQGQIPLGHAHNPVNLNASSGTGPGLSSVGAGGTGLSTVGNQAPSSVGAGGGGGGLSSGSVGPYGGSNFGGPNSGVGGLSGSGGATGGSGGVLGSAAGGVGRAAVGFGGGMGRGFSSGVGGPYPESARYSLSSGAGYQNQHSQLPGTTPTSRVTPGGIYQGIPPYY